MSIAAISQQAEAEIKRMVRCSARALIFLSLAWAFLTIGAFTVNPLSLVGIIFLILGIPCTFIAILYFICHRLHSQRAKKLLRQQEALATAQNGRAEIR